MSTKDLYKITHGEGTHGTVEYKAYTPLGINRVLKRLTMGGDRFAKAQRVDARTLHPIDEPFWAERSR